MTTASAIATAMAKDTALQMERITRYLNRSIERDGIRWTLAGCNDLGTLYWLMGSNRTKRYTLAGVSMRDVDVLPWI